MTQKERLADLYVNYYVQEDENKQFWLEDNRVDEYLKPAAEKIADYLLKNGVIVPPCKVGSCIYLISKNSSVPAVTRIDNVLFDGDEFQYNMDDDMFFDFSEDDIGKTAFATYKAAEQALKEREL